MSEKAMFGAGCFWGVEHSFRKIEGVLDVQVGYSGGHLDNPTYEQVCAGNTGHAEVVLVEFDSETVSYEELLEAFWNMHDPTSLNRQGPDVGSQYRSAIFYFDDEQRQIAEKSKKDKQPDFSKEIVTEITSAGKFWRAEEYHQRYFEKQRTQGCKS